MTFKDNEMNPVLEKCSLQCTMKKAMKWRLCTKLYFKCPLSSHQNQLKTLLGGVEAAGREILQGYSTVCMHNTAELRLFRQFCFNWQHEVIGLPWISPSIAQAAEELELSLNELHLSWWPTKSFAGYKLVLLTCSAKLLFSPTFNEGTVNEKVTSEEQFTYKALPQTIYL